MVDKDILKLGPPQLLVVVATLVAVAWLVSTLGTPTGGISSLEALLPGGERPTWYWTRMENSGYEVTAVNYEPYDFVEYQVMKAGQSYAVQLSLDPEAGIAVAVTIVGGQVADDHR